MKPLAGIRVVSLALNVPGPVAAQRLRDLGAAVTKVEPPGGDPLASMSPAWYERLSAGQEVARLDVKESGDRASLDVLLEQGDLLLTSQRPAALARLSLAWPALHARFPDLRQVAIVGFREPDQDVPGHDLTYAASRGLLTPPRVPETLVADLGGAQLAVEAALALLLAPERDRGTSYVEVALSDAADFFAAPLRYGLTVPGAVLGGGLPYYGVYPAEQGWVAVAALEARFQERLRLELGLAELAREELEQAFTARTADEWEAWARARDLPLAAVRAAEG